MKTLFEIEPEPDQEPLAIELSGYARAVDVTPRRTTVGQEVVTRWHLDVESFRETREGIEQYVKEWGEECDKIVRVKIVATEDVEGESKQDVMSDE